jgi:hypothetical protein
MQKRKRQGPESLAFSFCALQVIGSSISPFSLAIWDRCRHQSRIFRPCQLCILGLPRGCSRLALRATAFGLPIAGFPYWRVLPLCPGMDIRVASNHASPGLRPGLKIRVAPGLFPLALPSSRLRVAPNPAQTTGSTMVPRQSSNFASSACAADESSRSAGSCAFLPDPGCSFNLFRPSASASRRRTSRFNCALHRPVRLEVRFQIPTGSPTEWRVGWVGLWTQVQIRGGICGFHRGWCR